MKFLELIDIYGTQYQFKYFGNDQYKSKFSLILSLLTVTGIVVMTAYFGMDIWLSINPKIITQFQMPDLDRGNYTNNDNFTIAWRVETDDTLQFPIENFLYPVFLSNLEGNKGNLKMLEATRCSTLKKLDPSFVDYIQNKTDEWYCLDLASDPEFSLVKFWQAKSAVLQFKIGYCPKLDLTSLQCTSYEKLHYELIQGSNKRIKFIMPTNRFDSLNFDHPMAIDYVSYDRTIDLNMVKAQDFTFRRVKMYVDDGLIGETWKHNSYIALNNYMYDVWKSFPKESYLQLKSLYNLDFKFDGNFDTYKLIFMKLQDLAANVGGFLGIITSVCIVLSAFYHNFFMRFRIYNTIFDFTIPDDIAKDNIISLKGNCDKPDAAESNDTENIELQKEIANGKNGAHKKHVTKKNNNIGKVDSDKEKKGEFVIYGVSGSNENQDSAVAATTDVTQEDFDKFQAKKTKGRAFTYREYFEYYKDKDSMDKELKENIELARKFEDKVTDFRCITNLVIEIEQLKAILFNQSQIDSFKLMKHLKICSLDKDYIKDLTYDALEDKLEDDRQIKMINYFIKKIHSGEIDHKDKTILKLLDDDIKQLIYSKVKHKTDYETMFTHN